MATIALSAPPTEEDIGQHPRVFAAWRVMCIDAMRLGGVQQENTVLVDHLAKRSGTSSFDPTQPLTFARLVDLLAAIDRPPDSCAALAASDASLQLAQTTITRRPLGPSDVRVEIAFCGICHTDIDCLTGEWAAGAWYPQVAGHEVVGIATAVGPDVTTVRVGDAVGVGFLCRTCGTCDHCTHNGDQFCSRRVYTFNARDWDGSITAGGFSSFIVVQERLVLHIPPTLPLPAAAPLLCAGVTTYSAIKRFGVAGKHVGVVGLGGLGHLAVRILKATGSTVTVLSRSESKREHALRMGADAFVLSSNMRTLYGQLHVVIDTVSGQHDVAGLLPLLAVDGTLVLLGIPDAVTLRPFDILPRRLSLAGSVLGSLEEHQELLDMAGQDASLAADVSVVPAADINEALERVSTNTLSTSSFRVVVDMLTL